MRRQLANRLADKKKILARIRSVHPGINEDSILKELQYQNDIVIYQDVLTIMDAYAEAHETFAAVAEIVKARAELFDSDDPVSVIKLHDRQLAREVHSWYMEQAIRRHRSCAAAPNPAG